MKLVRKKEIPIEVCYDLSVRKNHNFFANGVCVHNTNLGFGVHPNGEYWCQSRENIITPEKDNAGSAMFCEANKTTLLAIAENVACLFDPSGMIDDDIVIFGEWCGSGIQKGVALSALPKMFVIFGIATVDSAGEKTYLTRSQVVSVCEELVSLPTGTVPTTSGIYCIYYFPWFEMEINFDAPHEVQNKLNEITELVEAACPVGTAFGENGVGEGVVWRCVNPAYSDSGFWFKVKGEKHSASKVKTLATVDVERINDIKQLAETLAHNGRLEQMAQTTFDLLNGGEVELPKLGEFIKNVMKDIFKEELDTIAASGFTGKDLNGPISKICRDFVMKQVSF